MGHQVRLDDYFAVYGSLMSGLSGPWAKLIAEGLVRLGPCQIPGVLYDLGAYPGLVHGEGDSTETVAGELYRVVQPAVFG
ncbi:MAG: gamma-glutamylcyclotransferase family protein, partial [Acidobacteriota bacterium]|nr:gamma-glutamylcyclotransferase family protein [Acidobacteriota bacterium]